MEPIMTGARVVWIRYCRLHKPAFKSKKTAQKKHVNNRAWTLFSRSQHVHGGITAAEFASVPGELCNCVCVQVSVIRFETLDADWDLWMWSMFAQSHFEACRKINQVSSMYSDLQIQRDLSEICKCKLALKSTEAQWGQKGVAPASGNKSAHTFAVYNELTYHCKSVHIGGFLKCIYAPTDSKCTSANPYTHQQVISQILLSIRWLRHSVCVCVSHVPNIAISIRNIRRLKESL